MVIYTSYNNRRERMTKRKEKKRPYNIQFYPEMTKNKRNQVMSIKMQQSEFSGGEVSKQLITQASYQQLKQYHTIPSQIKQSHLQAQNNEPFSSDYDLILKKQLAYISSFLSLGHQMEQSELNEIKTKKIQNDNNIQCLSMELVEKQKNKNINKRTNKQVWKCQCGMSYQSLGRFKMHKTRKHPAQIQQQIFHDLQPQLPIFPQQSMVKNSRQAFHKQQAVTISTNWHQRIMQCFYLLNLSQEQFMSYLNWIRLQKVELDIRIPGYKLLQQFYNSQSYLQTKLSIISFVLKLNKFLDAHEQFYKIWVLDFNNVSLLIYPFYGWLIEQKQYEEQPIFVMKHYTEFISQMFVVFNNWVYWKEETDILVVQNGVKFYI